MKNNKLYGAILGDLAGQPYEFKYKGDYSEFNIHDPKAHFTDDTIMTLATAKAMLEGNNNFKKWYLILGSKYLHEDYFGKRFKKWIKDEIACESSENDSWGNDCLMRISPLMYLENKVDAQNLAIESCFCSHLASQSIIAVNKLFELYQESGLRKHAGKYKPENHVKRFEKFDVTAKGTIEFIENLWWVSNSTHQVIEFGVKCGGDTDTNASIVGELMNYTFQDLTKEDIEYVESKLNPYLLSILHEFNQKF
jgi:ADP-ribosyl-[dinitrogen reductase] hydrolase